MSSLREQIIEHYTGRWGDFYSLHVQGMRASGSEAVGNCPLCEEQKGHFYANMQTGQFDCKKCGESGDAFTFYAQMKGLDVQANFPAILSGMSEDAGIFTGEGIHKGNRKPPAKPTGGGKYYLTDVQPVTEATASWLRERGRAFSLETWRHWARRAVYHPGGHKCIAFPQPSGGYHCWLVDVKDGKPWRFADGGKADLLGQIEGDRVYLCEGEWDVMSAWDRGEKSVLTNTAGCGIWKNEWSKRFQGLDVYICYDADKPGRKGQATVARALQHVARSVHLVQWPDGLEEGFDLRDWLTGGHSVEELSFTEWKPEEIKALTFKNELTIGELISKDYVRPTPLLQRDGDTPILGANQILVIGAATSGGKTVSCFNIGMCLACGLKAFATWGPEKPVRVYHIHAESENPYYVKEQVMKLLSDRGRVTEEHQELIKANFKLSLGTELSDGEVLNVLRPEHQRAIVKIAQDFGAELVMLDPIYWVSGGGNENESQQMQAVGMALRAIVSLARCAVLATVHFNKSGHITGSYAIQAWASTILELRLLSGFKDFGPDDIGIYLVKARNGPPRDGRDRWHIVLNRESLWYDMKAAQYLPDVEELLSEKKGRKKQYEPDVIEDILSEKGDLSYMGLVDALVKSQGCSEPTAKRLISQAKKQSLIRDKGRILTLETAF